MKKLSLCVAMMIGGAGVAPRPASAQVENIKETSPVQDLDVDPPSDPVPVEVLVVSGNDGNASGLIRSDSALSVTQQKSRQANAAAQARKAVAAARNHEEISRRQAGIVELQKQIQVVADSMPSTGKDNARARILEQKFYDLRKAQREVEREKLMLAHAAAEKQKAAVHPYKKVTPLSKETLGIQFDADIAKRQEDLKEIKMRVEKMETTLEKRIADKDKIIDLRWQVIQNDALGLGWSDQP